MSLVEQALKRAKAKGSPLPLSTSHSANSVQQNETRGVVETVGDELAAQLSPASEEIIEPSPEITATVRPLRFKEVDFERLRRMGYVPPANQERSIAEQFRHIKRPLLARVLGRGTARQEGATILMVSSALPGEGKTFCSLNLAMNLALEVDASVVLVDADTAKPQLTQAFDVQDEPGLVDALSDSSVDVASLVIETSVPKLSILPTGRAPESASELLSSARMAAVMQRLATFTRNRIVLVDSPPLLVTNEAKALVDLAGQVVLVVKANSTPQRAVLDAIGHLREDQFVGLVLNQSDTVSGAGYGYGYYGHMYNYGQAGR
jgi:receptor protein-tyrosine kinase